jgi:hypothetical protein
MRVLRITTAASTLPTMFCVANAMTTTAIAPTLIPSVGLDASIDTTDTKVIEYPTMRTIRRKRIPCSIICGAFKRNVTSLTNISTIKIARMAVSMPTMYFYWADINVLMFLWLTSRVARINNMVIIAQREVMIIGLFWMTSSFSTTLISFDILAILYSRSQLTQKLNSPSFRAQSAINAIISFSESYSGSFCMANLILLTGPLIATDLVLYQGSTQRKYLTIQHSIVMWLWGNGYRKPQLVLNWTIMDLGWSKVQRFCVLYTMAHANGLEPKS